MQLKPPCWPADWPAPKAAALPGSEPGLLHVDESLIVLSKPAGCIVHPVPSAANEAEREISLVDHLLITFPQLAEVPRCGVVHRIDRDTTGLLVFARHPDAWNALTAQLRHKQMRRHYRAIVKGHMLIGTKIDAPIGRQAGRRRRQVEEGGREAVTTIRVLEHFGQYSHVQAELETGRTHQIRVHLEYVGYPILGDPIYRGQKVSKGAKRLVQPSSTRHATARRQQLRPFADASNQASADPAIQLKEALSQLKRQALHAWRLELRHPGHQDLLEFEAPLPSDYWQVLQSLRSAELGA